MDFFTSLHTFPRLRGEILNTPMYNEAPDPQAIALSFGINSKGTGTRTVTLLASSRRSLIYRREGKLIDRFHKPVMVMLLKGY